MALADDPGAAHDVVARAARHGDVAGGLGPVSYTHLDVYKRQALNIMWANKISLLIMKAIFIATLNVASDAVSLKCSFTAVANFPVKNAISKRSSIDNKEVKRTPS